MFRNKLSLVAAALVILLSACADLQEQEVYNKPDSESASIEQRIDQWLSRAERQAEPEASHSRIKAARLLLENQQQVRAKTVFSRVQKNSLDSMQQIEHQLLSAQFLRIDGDDTAVLKVLDQAGLRIDNEALNSAQKVEANLLRSWVAGQQSRPLDSARARSDITGLLQDELDQAENREAIWLTLGVLDEEQLTAALNAEADADFRGWLNLAQLYKRNQTDVFALRQQLTQWRASWPTHPAAIELPMELASAMALDEDIPRRVTLMLPASGKLGAAGNAIRDGFLAAYYDTQQAGGLMTLKMIDSSAYGSFSEAYNSALADNPDMIVGPLRKPELAALQHLTTEDGPTVLALNYLDEDPKAVSESEAAPNFYQFGLAASDEARQISEMLIDEIPKRALLIRPTGAWGERVANAFKQPWLDSGAIVLDEVSYSKGDNLSALLKQALLVDQSELRKNRVQSLIEEKLEFVPRRRKDIDLFFLLARPEQARSLKPILAFHYAGDVPVYSTSQVFAGRVRRHRDRDLNDIIFTETPWLLNNDNSLRSRINELLPSKTAYARMQAFGVDAFGLAIRLGYLSRTRDSQFSGVTGRLSLGENKRIRRQLDIAQFVAGKPVPVVLPYGDDELTGD